VIRPILIAIAGVGLAATPPGALRVSTKTVPKAADCGAGAAIQPNVVPTVLAAVFRSIVLEGAANQGGQKKWCARAKPVFVISAERAEIRDCRRVVIIGRPDEALRRADTTDGGTEYIKLDVQPQTDARLIEIVVERGRIVKESDAVQVRIGRKRDAGADQPTLFREEQSRYRVTVARNRIELCQYSSVVI